MNQNQLRTKQPEDGNGSKLRWDIRSPLAPLLFEDDEWLDPSESGAVVVQVLSATPAKRKASTKHTLEKFPVQSFRTLLTNLSTIAKNRVQPKLAGVSVSFDLTAPTSLQQKAFDLLGVSLTFQSCIRRGLKPDRPTDGGNTRNFKIARGKFRFRCRYSEVIGDKLTIRFLDFVREKLISKDLRSTFRGATTTFWNGKGNILRCLVINWEPEVKYY
ncbi:hypothetical protein QUB05_18400 [Microcoleus sp. F10-C6]|uniref:hypothetical protein n=1 Tax=unclassified Microcoleus TaxID=2642155 RepID=UPI002FCF8E38